MVPLALVEACQPDPAGPFPSPNCALCTQRPAFFSYTKDCELLETKWNILLVGIDIMR